MQARIYEFFLKKEACDILLCRNDKEAKEAQQAALLAGKSVILLPDFKAKFGDDLRSYSEELKELSLALREFYKFKTNSLLISPYETLEKKLPTLKNLEELKLNFGDKINGKELREKFLSFSYESVDIVQNWGEFSFRKDIIDIFPINSSLPYRISLENEEIESLRTFDLSTQLSHKNEEESLRIFALLSTENYEESLEKIENLESSSLVKDYSSLAFWALYENFENFLDKYKVLALEKYEEHSFPLLPPAKIYKSIKPKIDQSFFDFHANKKIKVLARNQALARAFYLENYKNIELILSELIIFLSSEQELIISLNKELAKKTSFKSKIIIDELKVGSLVVHRDYGIGKFLALENIEVLGKKREFFVILYQNQDKLMLPVENLYKVYPYVGSDIAKLDKLGKGSFAKIKEKVKEKLFLIASELIKIAAKRELLQAEIFPESEDYQKFINEAGFEYTSDQKKVSKEILEDLQSGKIMDRLLSGDVGFGKTEIAMNAIFLCVKAGFQALFFVPTTLLSTQHYLTMKKRFENLDIPVYKYDRFSSANEKRALKEALQAKKALVCVGTHSLLSLHSEAVKLIVIDEEHKFGVKQKEKLKEISLHSHLLSMSATPIPRSLNMALSSIKTYSTLMEAPLDRKDIRSFLKEYDEKVVKEAIFRELRRKGQVFYIHNHIASIEIFKAELLKIIPHLRILVLHSKIDAKKSEEELDKFLKQEYDLLLSTSIIESGIHIPNANTILINNANHFGIADLHQLRGRVGRSSKQGYCYFFIKDKEELSEDSLKRLLALENNSYLGAGMLLAHHDLEIRGGGNIIGDAQSGHIEAIGYSLYLKMLEENINDLMSKKEVNQKNIDFKLSVNAYLNSDLIPEDRLRLDLYKRLSQAWTLPELQELSVEIEDRFGEIDIYSKQFLQLMEIRILASKLAYKAIRNSGQNISLIKENDEKVEIKARSLDEDDILAAILNFLKEEKKIEN